MLGHAGSSKGVAASVCALDAALEAYGLLKVSGKSQGFASLRAGLGTPFKAQGRRTRAANDDEGNNGSTDVA